jgi:hypothetical protein
MRGTPLSVALAETKLRKTESSWPAFFSREGGAMDFKLAGDIMLYLSAVGISILAFRSWIAAGRGPWRNL